MSYFQTKIISHQVIPCSFSDLRGKEEEDEMGGIVLGPQRKSFGTGCHVTTNFSRRNDSPKEHERDGYVQFSPKKSSDFMYK